MSIEDETAPLVLEHPAPGRPRRGGGRAVDAPPAPNRYEGWRPLPRWELTLWRGHGEAFQRRSRVAASLEAAREDALEALRTGWDAAEIREIA